MRHIVQFVIPALIVLGLVYAFARTRRNRQKADESGDSLSDAGVVLVVLVGAVLAVALVVALSS
jgi:hypothetical protein